MSSMDVVPITVPEGTFMIEERKASTIRQLMHRFLKIGGVYRYMPAVPVALPDSFQRALPKFENQDGKTQTTRRTSGNGFINCRHARNFTEFLLTPNKEWQLLPHFSRKAFSPGGRRRWREKRQT